MQKVKRCNKEQGRWVSTKLLRHHLLLYLEVAPLLALLAANDSASAYLRDVAA
jgi:hypothetical protein